MEAKKFKLFIGYLGNGATISNSAVYENGDYKTIAHISPAGVIKLYVAPDYIPAADMEKINNVALRHKNETLTHLNNTLADSKYNTFESGYYKLLNELERYTPFNAFSDLLTALIKENAKETKKQLIIDYYLKFM